MNNDADVYVDDTFVYDFVDSDTDDDTDADTDSDTDANVDDAQEEDDNDVYDVEFDYWWTRFLYLYWFSCF